MGLRVRDLNISASNDVVLRGYFDDDAAKGRNVEIKYDSSPFAGKDRLFNAALNGKWELTEDHELAFRITGTKNRRLAGKSLVFSGAISNVAGNKLSVRLRDYRAKSGRASKILELKGQWEADIYNRLVFSVKRKRNVYDTLVFSGKWDINKDFSIEYTHDITNKKTKTVKKTRFILKGKWSFKESRVEYTLSDNSGTLSFKGKISKKNFIYTDSRLNFIIEFKKNTKDRRSDIIGVLGGKWNLTRDLGCSFEVKARGRRVYEINFGIDIIAVKDKYLELQITGSDKNKLGVTVSFKTVFNDHADLFAALKKKPGEYSILGGIRIQF